jgi:hypothetical protein
LRTQQHVPEQTQRLGRPERGDAAHVSDDRALRDEIGRYHEELSTLRVLGGNGLKHVLVDIAGNEFAQMRIHEQARPKCGAHDARRTKQAFGDTLV